MRHFFLRLILLLLCFAPAAIYAQTPVQDVVYLKNGAIIKGAIRSYEPGNKLVIDIGEGRFVTFLDTEILRIEQQRAVGESITTIDWVILYNGSMFRGKIRSETPAELVLELSNGERLTLTAKEIKEIWRNQPAEAGAAKPAYDYAYIPLEGVERRKKEYAFRERGWFNTTSFTMPNGMYGGEKQFGVGLHNLVGYQFSRLLGLGLGVGFDAFNPSDGEYIASIYGEGRSYLLKKRTAPFVSLGAGYGFAFRNAETFITGAKGGLRVHPSVGLRLGADEDLNLLLDVGYIFQSATYTREIDFFDPRIEIREVDYRRFTIRLGAMF